MEAKKSTPVKKNPVGRPRKNKQDASVDKVRKPRTVQTPETLIAELDALHEKLAAEILRVQNREPNTAKSAYKPTGVNFIKSTNKAVLDIRKKTKRVTAKYNRRSPTNKNTANSGFLKPVSISSEMADFTGWDVNTPHARVDITRFICKYIEDHDLQNPDDKRQILPDKALSTLLKYDPDSEPKLTYSSIQKYLKHHFPKESEI